MRHPPKTMPIFQAKEIILTRIAELERWLWEIHDGKEKCKTKDKTDLEDRLTEANQWLMYLEFCEVTGRTPGLIKRAQGYMEVN